MHDDYFTQLSLSADHGLAIGVPIAAGLLYPSFGLLLSPMMTALAMSLSSVSVGTNALRLSGSTVVANSHPDRADEPVRGHSCH